ncbi:MAG: BACON domain-containing protein [Verrucomicrobiia bacterium]
MGNTNAQEYGDAVYVYLEDVWSEIGYNYNHTAIFAGLDSNNNARVLQAFGSGTTTMETNLYDFFTVYGSEYYGAYTLSNATLTFPQRNSIVSTAINLANAQIPYPSTLLQIPVCIDYAGTPPVSIANIENIRCDGVVEYSYTYNGLRVWHNTSTPDSEWGIVNYPDSYNDPPGLTRYPDIEASPWAQRGAPCDTGPGIYTVFGCSYDSPDTQMTQPAVISLPTYEVTQASGCGYADVTIQATDESGIHYIGVELPGSSTWTYSPTQPEHPTSDSYAYTIRVFASGTLNYFAMDNGGNYPAYAADVKIAVPPSPSISPTSVELPAKGGSKTIKVKASGTGCDWTAVSNDPFITVTEGASGSGSETVRYSVPGNTNTVPLTGTMTIAGQTFTVNQAAGGCTFSLSPKSAKYRSVGGSKTVKVKARFSDCAWTAVSNDSFITITGGASGVGNGTVSYTVAGNTNNAPLTGTLTIGDEAFTITESAAP